MRRLGVIVVLVWLAGCATTERFTAHMDSYVGADLAVLRDTFGYNYIERSLGDGLRAFTWTWVDRGTYPAYRTPDVITTYETRKGTRVVVHPGYYFPPERYEFSCEFTFIVDAAGKATGWRAQGNGCAHYPGAARVLRSGDR